MSGSDVVLFDGVCGFCDGAIRFIIDLIAKRMMSESRTPRRLAIRLMLRRSPSPRRMDTACFRWSTTQAP